MHMFLHRVEVVQMADEIAHEHANFTPTVRKSYIEETVGGGMRRLVRGLFAHPLRVLCH